VTAGVVDAAFTITNAGSGYVEQPTITFTPVSGGNGAAAYATVGSNTTIKGIGSNISFATASGTGFGIDDAGTTTVQWWKAIGGAFTGILRSTGSTQDGLIQTSGTGGISLQTSNGAQTQFKATHTASAVNYVQVTGGVTGNDPIISAQGSDANVRLLLRSKGSLGIRLQDATGNTAFATATGGGANYLSATGSATTVAPALSAQGDTDVSIALVPKGLGIVLMNQQTPAAVTATGTLTIANLLTQIITSTSATAVSLTLPTGTLSDAGISGGTSAVNTSFDYSIINTGSAVGDVTLVAGTAHTIVGSVSVPVGTTGRFRCRKTATNTFVSYRV
jgi:hypothetical protein